MDPGSNGLVNAVGLDAAAVHPRLARRHREQLARPRIEHDDVAALGTQLPDRILQLPLGDVLQLGVEREPHVVARNRVADLPRRRLEPASHPIAQEDRLARRAGEQAVERRAPGPEPPRLLSGGSRPMTGAASDEG